MEDVPIKEMNVGDIINGQEVDGQMFTEQIKAITQKENGSVIVVSTLVKEN